MKGLGSIRAAAALCSVVVVTIVWSTPAEAVPPTIDGEHFSNVGSSSATLRAQINSLGLPTTYHFEYGKSAAYGSSTPQESLGSANEDVGVLAQLSSLQPETTYHFRVVATNAKDETTLGADTFFTVQPIGVPGLPDQRGYEMVSPLATGGETAYEPTALSINPNGGNSINTELLFEAAASGDAVTYLGSSSATGGTGEEGADAGNQYLAVRAPGGGWAATNIEPPSGSSREQPVYEAFSSDLSVGILDWNGRTGLTADALAGGYPILYTRASSDGSYHALLTTAATSTLHRTSEEFLASEIARPGLGHILAYAGTSSNLKHLLFEANDALTAQTANAPEAKDGGPTENNLYESTSDQLRLVNVLPNGTTEPNAIFGSPADEAPSENPPDFSHVISEDGTRIFWTDLNTGHIYVRENGEITVPVSEGSGRFWTATPNGRYVFYTEGEKLWRFDVDTEAREELAGAGANAQGVIGTSEDGSYAYFMAGGALAPGASSHTCQHTESVRTGCNLYLFHRGEPLRFILELSGTDDRVFLSLNGSVYGDWRPGLGHRTAEVTSNGHRIVFTSDQDLTPYESQGRQEVYVYDADTNQVSCVSCNPTGQPPASIYPAYLPPSHSNTYQPRWMSEDGTRVFFDSSEALVPQDMNGKQDVYEWEREGIGSCTAKSQGSASGGCVYLLSDGTSSDNSFLLDASVDGSDVFVITRAQLAPKDRNDNFNVFDVRVGASRPPVPPACSGTGCQSVPLAPPIFATPSSVTFSGVGNFSPSSNALVKLRPKTGPKGKKCKKRFVKRHGKCVKAKGSVRGRR